MKLKLFLIFLLIFNIANSLVIEHVPMEKATVGNSVYIYAKVLDSGEIREVKLHYKGPSDVIYTASIMQDLGNGIFLGIIPANLATTAGFEYFIAAMASDGTMYYSPCVDDCTRRTGSYRVDVVLDYCEDDTPYSQCSETKPQRCINGILQDDCEICGCLTGTCQANGSCILETPPANETPLQNQTVEQPPIPGLENVGLLLFLGIALFIVLLFFAVILRR